MAEMMDDSVDEFADERWPRRPTLERLKDGDAVFIRGIISERGGATVSLMQGEAYIGVATRGYRGPTSVGSQSVSVVTRAADYASADELQYANARNECAQEALASIRAALDGDDALAAIRAILNPPTESDADE